MSVPLVLALDPATLTAVGLGLTALTGATSLIGGLTAPKAPSAPAAPPPSSLPQGTPSTNKAPGSSFLAAAAGAPPAAQQGGKTLLGQ